MDSNNHTRSKSKRCVPIRRFYRTSLYNLYYIQYQFLQDLWSNEGIKKGNTNAFEASVESIDEAYVDGVSITLGDSRKHVWTYAIGISDSGAGNAVHYCCYAAIIGPDPPSLLL